MDNPPWDIFLFLETNIGNFNLPNLGIGITLKPMMLDHVELADEASNTYPRTIQPVANT